MKKVMFLWLSIFSVFLGCEANFFEIAQEPAKDPEASIPRTESFTNLLGIPISWDKDPLATGYVLWRQLPSSASAEEIYRGEKTSFLDTTASAQTMYIYSLAKVRGKKEFPKSASVPGLYDSFNTVTQANGKTPSSAIPLTNIVNGVVFYSQRSTLGPEIQTFNYSSSDWYYYDIPPGMRVQFKVNYTAPLPISYLYFNHGSDLPVLNSGTPDISNPGFSTQRVYFSIRYNTSAGADISFFKLEYKITIDNITLISP